MEAPHKMVGDVLADVVGGAQSIGSTIKGVFDMPLDAVGAPEGPHAMVDNVANEVAHQAKRIVRVVTG